MYPYLNDLRWTKSRNNFHFALEAAAMGMLDILAGILVWADTIRYVDWMSG